MKHYKKILTIIPAYFVRYRSEIIVFFLAFLVRIIFFVIFLVTVPEFPFIGSDSYNYVDGARSLLATGRFIQLDTGESNSYEMPGYPLFLAGLSQAFTSWLAVPIAQNIIMGLCAVLIWRIGLLFSRKVAWTAALFFAFEPAGIFYSNAIVTEPIFIFLTLVFLYVLLMYRNGLLSGALAPGVLLGAATMVRPIGAIFLPAVLVFYLVGKNLSLKQTGIFFGIFFIGWFAVVGPWMLRNKILFGRAELSAVASFQVYHQHAPHFYAYKNSISERDAERIFQERLERLDPYTEEVRAGKVGSLRHAPYMWQVGLDYIRQYPFQFGAFHILKTVPFFVSDGLRQIARDTQLHAIPAVNLGSLALRGKTKGLFNALTKDPTTFILFSVGFLFWLGINIMMVIGSVALIRSSKGALRALVLFLLLAITLTSLVAGGAVAHPRFRYSVSPLMFLLAAVGLSHIHSFWLRRKLTFGSK